MENTNRGQADFSIIIATLNAEKTLETAIQSVLIQSYSKWQLIIIDGASTDNTTNVIKRYSSHIFYWRSEKDTGIYNAWNKGLTVVTSPWILFLGADDKLNQNALEYYSKFLTTNSCIDFVSGKIEIVKNSVPYRIVGKPWNWNAFKKYMNVAHVGSILSKNYFDRYGMFDENFKICGDYELLLRSQNNLRSGFVNRVIAQMDNNGISNQNIKVFEETFKAKAKNNSRSLGLLYYDKYISILKWKVRKILHR